MENTIENARNNMYEWWFIFSMTGDIQDARGLMESIRTYDLLLNNEVEVEM